MTPHEAMVELVARHLAADEGFGADSWDTVRVEHPEWVEEWRDRARRILDLGCSRMTPYTDAEAALADALDMGVECCVLHDDISQKPQHVAASAIRCLNASGWVLVRREGRA